MLDLAKYILTQVGARTSDDGFFRVADAALNYLEVGRWMKSHGYDVRRRFRAREDLFEAIAALIRGQRVLYLEFGVWQGASMRLWSRLLDNERTHLHGFDTFEGLPEKWHARKDRGYFSTRGATPDISDPRVRFFKGLFIDTLEKYKPPDDFERLVINIDADLYSSARTVLSHFGPMMSSGTIIYFDEFSDRHNELRAFDEFHRDAGMTFRLFGATRVLSHVAFEIA
jgi:hypothetical protein